jgi:hypothetical protein
MTEIAAIQTIIENAGDIHEVEQVHEPVIETERADTDGPDMEASSQEKAQEPQRSVIAPSFRVKEGWEEEAVCKKLDQSIFYNDKNEEALRAKYFCGTCAVANECLINAFRTEGRDKFGVRGGLTHKERGVVLRKREAQGAVAAAKHIDTIRLDARRKALRLIRAGLLDINIPSIDEARKIS